ncbi:MAG: YjgN family protein [Desulfobacterales bacterium]
MAGEIRSLDEDIGHLEMENQQAIDDFKRSSDAQNPEFTVYQVRQRLRLRFTGTGGEYFRIWIVNLFLTVLTLGIYSAWAKVRTRRYFYAHTLLADHPFDYRANPWFILRGNLILGFGLLLFLALESFGPVYSGIVLAAFYAFLPFLIYKSLRFNAYNSSYRNLRFQFRGSLKESYNTYLFIPLLIPLTLGLIFPYWVFRRKKYFSENFTFGRSPNTFTGAAGPFYQVYGFTGLMVILMAVVVGGGVFFFVLQPQGLALRLDNMVRFFTLLPITGFLVAMTAFTFIQQFLFARLTNYCWDRTSVGGLCFNSNLNVGSLLWLRLTNLIGIIISLGLLIPWARVRRVRYLVSSLTLFSDRSLDTFAAAEQSAESAIGEAATGFFDIDIGL